MLGVNRRLSNDSHDARDGSDRDQRRGRNQSLTIKVIRTPSTLRERQNAETGTARTNPARRAPNGHGAHEMARPTRSRSAAAAAPGAQNWTTGGRGLVRAPSATDRQYEKAVRAGWAASRRRRGSMIATVTTGEPRATHRETPESEELFHTEASAPAAGVARKAADQLRLGTAAPTPPIRPKSTAPPFVAEPVHIASKAVAAPPQE